MDDGFEWYAGAEEEEEEKEEEEEDAITDRDVSDQRHIKYIQSEGEYDYWWPIGNDVGWYVEVKEEEEEDAIADRDGG